MRSVDKYMPWIRTIYVVTNGQVPSWLDLKNPRVKIVTHEEIFDDPVHLPTFNSNAIELHLHQIKGISDKFLYLNDDFLIGKEVSKADFCFGANGHIIRRDYEHNMCSEGCPLRWLKDGTCHKTCNTTMCLFDGGDCLRTGVKVSTEFDNYTDARSGTWSKSMSFLNGVLSGMYGFEKRWTIAHAPYFMDKYVMGDLKHKLHPLFIKTSKTRFRSNRDVVLAFTYYYFIIGEKLTRPLDLYFEELDFNRDGLVGINELQRINLTSDTEFDQILRSCHVGKKQAFITKQVANSCIPFKRLLEKFEPLSRYFWRYRSTKRTTDTKVAFVRTNAKTTMYQMREWDRKRTKFLCMNDATSHNDASNNEDTARALSGFLDNIFPEKSSFEK